jgi:hypothetical protein
MMRRAEMGRNGRKSVETELAGEASGRVATRGRVWQRPREVAALLLADRSSAASLAHGGGPRSVALQGDERLRGQRHGEDQPSDRQETHAPPLEFALRGYAGAAAETIEV